MRHAVRSSSPVWLLCTGLLCLSLIACSSSRYAMRQDSAPKGDFNSHRVANAVPRVEPKSPFGNPASYVVRGKRYFVKESARGYVQRGIASWYGRKFHGHRTSSGEAYNMYAMTAAHKSLPLPCYVQVRNLKNQRQVIVRVNDRGPFHDNRLIDLSYAAAKKLGIAATGTGLVEVRAIDPVAYGKKKRKQRPYALQAFERGKDGAVDPKMYLQLGAFVSRHNAEQLYQRLSQNHHQATIDTRQDTGQPLYRVRIGPIANVDEADQLALQLKQHGFNAPQIVID